MYKLIIAPTNPNANGDFFNYWVMDTHNANSVEHNELNILVWFSNEPTQEIKYDIINKYNGLTAFDVLVTQDIKDGEELKRQRSEYGIAIYNRAAEMSRKQRLFMFNSTGENQYKHEQYRINNTDPLNHIVDHVCKGDFKTVYELLNAFTPTEYVKIETIIIYRILTSSYITSSHNVYTDIFGMRVKGGTYSEYMGETFDAMGFINNYGI